MSAQHTPGPWQVEGEGIRALIRGGDSTIVAVRHRLDGITHDANARLIAAAPELLKAARVAVTALAHICESSPHDEAFYGDAYRALDAAIAKATGDADV